MQQQGKVLVTGATGTVGKLLVDRLVEKGTHVRVLTRDLSKGKGQWDTPLVEFVQGDISGDDWVNGPALDGIERLFLLTVSSPRQPEQERRAAHAAKEKGVKQVVKLSVQGASQAEPSNSLMRWHALAEDAVASTGVDYVFLRPNLFLQNYLRDDASAIKHTGKFYRPAADCKISHVDVRDIADAAAAVLTEPIEKHSGATYYVNGPESLTYHEVAERISKVLGKKVEYVAIDDVAAFNTFKGFAGETFARTLVKLYQCYRSNSCALVYGDFKILTGKEPRSVEQFFIDHKGSF